MRSDDHRTVVDRGHHPAGHHPAAAGHPPLTLWASFKRQGLRSPKPPIRVRIPAPVLPSRHPDHPARRGETPNRPGGDPAVTAPAAPAPVVPVADAPAAPTPPAVVPPVAPVVPPAAPVVPPGAQVAADDLPDWAKDPKAAIDYVKQLRDEAASHRTGKEKAAQAAAEKAQADLTRKLGIALGLVTDDTVTVTPEQLEQKYTAERDAALATARDSAVELAVWRNAAAVGADPNALLDSRAFLTAIKDVDPTDQAAITAAITAAVQANARLSSTPATPPAPAAGSSVADFTGGPGSGPDLDAQIAEALKAGDNLRAIALKRQRYSSR